MSCAICSKSKAPLNCGLCSDAICKKCAHFCADDTFSFLPKVPAHLSHGVYCGTCFEQKVRADLEAYQDLMEAAKSTMVFMKRQSKETRLIKRLENVIEVKECADYDECVLRLAFLAAQLKYNAVIDVDIVAHKIINGAYQTTVYTGTGMPADVSEAKLIKDRSLWSNPN